MKDQVMKYKGQIGSAEFDFESDCLHGRLLYINDLVTYEAEAFSGLRKEFELAVDDYLATCEELGIEPNKPLKGSFNVRLGEDLHRRIAVRATSEGKSLNEACIEAIELYLEESPGKVIEHIHNHKHTHTYRQVPGSFEFEGEGFGDNNWKAQATYTAPNPVKVFSRGSEWQH